MYSSAGDGTLDVCKSYGAKIIQIPRESFDHGGTRTLAGKSSNSDIVVFMIQAALQADEYAVENFGVSNH